ncbi:MAG: peptidoglycan DD-metalloendopeptidase family protein [Coleofasciculaceae cyanobacterium]
MSSESEMTKETSPSSTPSSIFYRYPRLMKGLSLVSSFGVLSSGLVVAQTNSPVDTGMAPPQPAVAPAPEAPAPERARVDPEPVFAPEAPVREKAPVIDDREPIRQEIPPAPAPVREPERVVERKPILAPPDLSIPDAATVSKPPATQLNPAPVQETAKSPIPPTNTYIDRTDYSVGATRNYQAPDRVLLTERSTGCSTISQNGQLQSGNCGIIAPAVAPTASQPNQIRPLAVQPTQQRANIQPTPAQQRASAIKLFEDPRPVSTVGQQQLGKVPKLPMPQVVPIPNVATNQPVNVGPLRVSRSYSSPETPASYPVYSPSPNYSTYSSSASPLPTSLAYYNLTRRPFGRLKMGRASFMFPLSIPTEITSIFGWRIHPISGDQRFHSGTDMGAPEGTPVLAAVSGQVVTADLLGGYGLTVILQHEKGTQESLYAHMSQIFVKPGDQVEQGNVIGRVGNTGNSTGPHLHFEWRHLTPQGWVAVDAGPHLQYSLAQFTRALQLAQSVPQRGR